MKAWQHIGENMKKGGLSRLLAAWLLVLINYAWRYRDQLSEPSLAEGIAWIPFLLTVAILYLTLSLLAVVTRNTEGDRWILGITSLVYASIIAFTAQNLYTGLGVCLILGFILWYLLARKGSDRDLSPAISIPLTVAVTLLLALFVGGYTVLRYKSFSSPNFDFGIFSQMFYHMKERLLPLTTVERDGLLSHFAIHISPVYYLILPFYCLFPSPITLQIAQAVLLASGVIPLYLLSRKLGFSHRSTFFWCCAYCFYPALSGGASFDLHENGFLAPFLLWLFYFAESGKRIPMYGFAFLVLTVKEDAAVYVAFFALFLLIDKRKKRDGLLLFLLAVGCFLLEVLLLQHYGEGIMNYRYNGYYTEGGTLIDAVLNLIRNPALVFRHLITADRMEFLFLMLVPLLGLPFLFGRKPTRLLLLGPFFLVNLMPQYSYQYSIYFQYVFGSLAFLFYASMLNTADKRRTIKRAVPAICSAFALILSFSSVIEKGEIFKTYQDNKETYDRLENYLAMVPEDISVKASTFLIPHLAERDTIYVLETTHEVNCVVLDLRYPYWERTAEIEEALKQDPSYTCIAREESLIAIYQRTETIGN